MVKTKAHMECSDGLERLGVFVVDVRILFAYNMRGGDSLMLKDIERKVLRILWNYSSGRRRMPTIKELCIKTEKHEKYIRLIIGRLAEERYLEWDGYNTITIKIINGWEQVSRPRY